MRRAGARARRAVRLRRTPAGRIAAGACQWLAAACVRVL